MSGFGDGRLAVTVAEAAQLLGCSRHTVYRIIRDGKLQVVRLRAKGPIFIAVSALRDLVASSQESAVSK